MALIHGDLVRTGHHIYCLPALPLSAAGPIVDPNSMFSGHLRKMERILYTLGMVNRALSYNQGFNELLQPFYHLLFSMKHVFQNDEMVIECLAFQFLLRLLNETRLAKLFVVGISVTSLLNELSEFSKLLQKLQPRVHARLARLELEPFSYCYRWFSLLFAQEFEMPNVLMIWDHLLLHVSELTRYSFLVGLGFLKCWEKEIPAMGPPEFLAQCQALRPQDIPAAIAYADATWHKLFL
jgi:hypothetical protein